MTESKTWEEFIDEKYGITSSVDPTYRFLRAEKVSTLIADIHSLLKEQREICMKEYQRLYQEGYTEISIAIDTAPPPTRERWNENVGTCSECGIEWKKIGKQCPVCYSPPEPEKEK